MTFLDFGGIERKMEKLSVTADEHQWIFVALNRGGLAERRIIENGKRAVCLNLPYSIPNLCTLYTLYKFMVKEAPDVLHAAGAEAIFFGVLAAKLAGVKTIIAEEIGIPKHSKIAKFIFKYIYGLASYVTGESQSVIDHLSREYQLHQDRLKKIPNFIGTLPLMSCDRAREKSGIFTIISVARLEPVKNIELALRAIKRIINDSYNVKYLILGEGSQRSNLESLAKRLGIADRVEFTGLKADPIPYLLTSNLFLLTSNSEGFSNSLLEAMYYQVPSISTKVGGAEDIIIDRHNGWLVNVNDEKQLYDKLIYILSMSKDQLFEIGKTGSRIVIDKYTLENHLNQTYKIYGVRK